MILSYCDEGGVNSKNIGFRHIKSVESVNKFPSLDNESVNRLHESTDS